MVHKRRKAKGAETMDNYFGYPLIDPDRANQPVRGHVIGYYAETDFFIGWVEKSVAGNINNGLMQDLITHYRELDDGPPAS